ncbi:MAG: nucleoside triphosphate pyrophosphohydrolase [Bacteroidales bacterium]|jgi:XTP/dITP diphosphohydrolase|nr:nucleoside triphosphate pyrophosphohydrolase [Bacteroidales bacterium]MDD3690583.1 nucleoside triphosphate pyrophosphohydrolase [Bacteroidales bacterium]MDD4044051.1 nucleoside triphosphate pyrophosphohydrolase [Bacteroidales bacterium]MDX9890071.1 nucleoside triphosphate pyrophosphohydrolase [Bacteroidales bacterium]NLO42637.1 nucleoside triphosphate pyrophosphohydrolase [Bacteroidales bacterium]
MPNKRNHAAIDRLLSIMDELREKCPWDRKQTMDSLRYLTIEETYELSDAILKNDMGEIKKELGDILLHIVFYAKIASEQAVFDFADVVNGLCEKLIKRHPHVFGDVSVNNAEEVKANWEKIKLTEGRKSVLEGVPQSLPAMVKAYRIQEKVRGVGFDWSNATEVWEKVKEEIDEFEHEKDQQDTSRMEEEFGDILFALINYARFLSINPEDALERTNQKFIKRFAYLENQLHAQNKSFDAVDLKQMNVIWEESKKK